MTFFNNLDDAISTEVLRRGRVRSYRAAERIFTVGDDAHFLPIIITGRVKLVRQPEPGKEIILGTFGDGQAFAIPPVLQGTRFPATAVAMARSKLLLLGRRHVLDLMASSPEFSAGVTQTMCGLLRHHAEVVTIVAKPSAERRVGSMLINIAEEQGDGWNGEVDYRRQDLAEMTGLTIESTIRSVRKLAERGLIRIVRGTIFIDSVQRLRDLVSERIEEYD